MALDKKILMTDRKISRMHFDLLNPPKTKYSTVVHWVLWKFHSLKFTIPCVTKISQSQENCHILRC